MEYANLQQRDLSFVVILIVYNIFYSYAYDFEVEYIIPVKF